MKTCAVLLLAVLFPSMASLANDNSPTDAATAYTRTITQRADKIVATLGIADTNKTVRVREIITCQYRDLNTIHTGRDAAIRAAKDETDPVAARAMTQAAQSEAKQKLDKLHGQFLARLSAELSSEQVDKVKDGLTYGVVPLTHGVYLKLYPDLKAEEKRQIMAWLVEAREIAMDGSTSDEKHAVFGKYKGRINNYLSKAGYDSKNGERNLKRADRSPSENRSP